VAGVVSQDVVSRRLRPITAFRVSAVIAVVVPLGLALAAPDVSIARSVGLVFAVAASTFCPLLVLGIWWRRLTDAGALAGLAVGGTCSVAAVTDAFVGTHDPGWVADLLGQPAAWTVPLAFLTMIGVSLLTPNRVPGHVARFMVRLHTPEAVVLDRGRPARR
jgi:Na+(H+)/acetate symporter ActP